MSLNPQSFRLEISGGVAAITLARPDRLNALTFEVYNELTDTFVALNNADAVRAITITGEGRGFCSGGDVDDIIAELFNRDSAGLLEFTRITGRLIQSIREVSHPVVAAINGTCVGAGSVIAAACDLRITSQKTKFGFIFPKVGLCGADMGAAFLLPRIVGLGNASELLFFGDIFDADTAFRMGFVNRVVEDGDAARRMAGEWAARLAKGPAFAHSMTKTMIEKEHNMSLPEAIEAEAQAQATCMEHPDFRIAHDAYKNKEEARFVGSEVCDQ
jgi:enoyl-CoA hydratase/carnithine racemase